MTSSETKTDIVGVFETAYMLLPTCQEATGI